MTPSVPLNHPQVGRPRAAHAAHADGFSTRARLVLLLLAGLGACSKGGLAPGPAHPALLGADSNRDRLLGNLTIANLDRTLAAADALRGDGVLPFGGAELKQLLLARLRIEPKLFDLVDASRPIGLAFIVHPPTAQPGQATRVPPPLMAGLVTLKSLPAAAGQFAALGAPAEVRKDAQRFTRGRDSIWLARLGTQIAWSDSFEGLAEAGAHAFSAAQALQTDQTSTDDFVATIFPAAWQKASGGPALKQRALSAYEQQLRAGGQSAASERASVEAGLDYLLPSLEETDRLRIGVGLSAERGLGLGVDALARPGTAFAKRLASKTAYQLPTAASARELVSLLTFGPSPTWLGLMQAMIDRQAQANVPGAAAIAARLRALVPLLSGAVYVGARAEGERLGLDWAYGLAGNAQPTAALDALAGLLGDPALPVLLQQVWGRHTPRVEAKRTGNRLEARLVFPDSAEPGSPAALAHLLSGSSTLSLLAEAAPGRLVFATEPGAAPRLPTLLASQPGDLGGALAAAVGETGGREGLVYLDVWNLARPVLRASLAGNQRRFLDMILSIPGLSNLDLPLWLSVDSGTALSVQLRAPIATLKNASTLMSLLGGGGGLGP